MFTRRTATVTISAPEASIAAADEMHDLQPITLAQADLAIGRARHDLQVALERDLARVEAELPEQVGHRQRRGECPLLAVDHQTHRFFPMRVGQALHGSAGWYTA